MYVRRGFRTLVLNFIGFNFEELVSSVYLLRLWGGSSVLHTLINPRRACAARITVVTLSVCSINISPVECPGVKVKILIFFTCVNLVIKLFILCEILSLS